MKNILIVNDNLNIGGIQRSLVNFLLNKDLFKEYNFTLLLFSKTGDLINEIPKDVNIITPNKIYKILGLSRKELKQEPLLFIIKTIFYYLCKIIGKRKTLRIIGLFQNSYTGYDTVISFSNLTSDKELSIGCGEFVLDKTICNNKICYIHCDYKNSDTYSIKNNLIYKEFDKIACCSDSVRKRFLELSDIEQNKVYTVRNFYNNLVWELSEKAPYKYDCDFVNLIIVARLSFEKGIDISIKALGESERKDIRIYIVGNGPQKNRLNEMVINSKLEKNVFFLGEQTNPYRFMKNVDYLLVPSRYEAAPIVFDEAKVLGIPIISSLTTSAAEMLTRNDIITSDFLDTFKRIKKRSSKAEIIINNKMQIEQFKKIIESKNEK